jgi:hypothetical protein
MHARRGLVRRVQLGTSYLFFALGYTRLEHHFEGTHPLVRGSDDSASRLGFGLDHFEALLLDSNLDLAPIEHPLEITKQSHRQWRAWQRALGSVDLADDHPHACLSRAE